MAENEGVFIAQQEWQVNLHDEFLPEFRGFSASVRLQIYSLIEMLKVFGPKLGRPHVDTLKGSDYPNMKELRFRAENGAWRVAFAFDVKRRAILLVGGDKAGVSQRKFYRGLIEVADRRFHQHEDRVAKRWEE
jgi:hypothetical protein